jgi:hypothetical protein
MCALPSVLLPDARCPVCLRQWSCVAALCAVSFCEYKCLTVVHVLLSVSFPAFRLPVLCPHQDKLPASHALLAPMLLALPRLLHVWVVQPVPTVQGVPTWSHVAVAHIALRLGPPHRPRASRVPPISIAPVGQGLSSALPVPTLVVPALHLPRRVLPIARCLSFSTPALEPETAR